MNESSGEVSNAASPRLRANRVQPIHRAALYRGQARLASATIDEQALTIAN